jgi:hypothetical protein
MGTGIVAMGPMDDVASDTADGCLACGSVEVRHVGDGVQVSVELVAPSPRLPQAAEGQIAARVAQFVTVQLAQGLGLVRLDLPAHLSPRRGHLDAGVCRRLGGRLSEWLSAG